MQSGQGMFARHKCASNLKVDIEHCYHTSGNRLQDLSVRSALRMDFDQGDVEYSYGPESFDELKNPGITQAAELHATCLEDATLRSSVRTMAGIVQSDVKNASALAVHRENNGMNFETLGLSNFHKCKNVKSREEYCTLNLGTGLNFDHCRQDSGANVAVRGVNFMLAANVRPGAAPISRRHAEAATVFDEGDERVRRRRLEDLGCGKGEMKLASEGHGQPQEESRLSQQILQLGGLDLYCEANDRKVERYENETSHWKRLGPSKPLQGPLAPDIFSADQQIFGNSFPNSGSFTDEQSLARGGRQFFPGPSDASRDLLEQVAAQQHQINSLQAILEAMQARTPAGNSNLESDLKNNVAKSNAQTQLSIETNSSFFHCEADRQVTNRASRDRQNQSVEHILSDYPKKLGEECKYETGQGAGYGASSGIKQSQNLELESSTGRSRYDFRKQVAL